jgi:Trypsin-like peptidase domain
MPVTIEPLDALVSVWNQPHTGPDLRPIGSGVFIAPHYVLTARHVVADAQGKVWLGGVKDKHALIPVNSVSCPPESHVDIALLELAPNARQPWLRVDIRKQDLKQRKISLYGIFPHEKESTQTPDCTITTSEQPPGYYLTDYGQPMGYSGGVATIDGVMMGVISARVKGENQGGIIPVYAVGEWLQGAAKLRSSLVVHGAPEAPITLTPHDEFTRKVRTEIHRLLQQPSMEELSKALGQRTNSKTAAEVLVPLQPASLIESFDCLHIATKSCLQQVIQQPSNRVEQMKQGAREIFGWLVGLALDRGQAHAMNADFDPWQGGLELQIPLVSEVGIEVLVSSLGDRASWFKLISDPHKGDYPVGRDSFTVDDLEVGIGPTDQLAEILKRIWMHVMTTSAPLLHFGEQEQSKLRSTLRARERRKENHYYITVPPHHDHAPLANRDLLRLLLERLPELRVMYLGGAQGGGLLLLEEDDLWTAVRDFLLILRDTP